MKSKIGTELEPAGPSGKDTAFAGGSHLVVFNGSKDKDLANAFVDYMLEPANLNKFTSAVGFLPGTVDGIKASGYLDDPSASRSPSSSSTTPPSTRRPRAGARWRGRTSSTVRSRRSCGASRRPSRPRRTSPRRWTRSSPGEHHVRPGGGRGAHARPAAQRRRAALARGVEADAAVILLLPR
jgi:hypothetical protein